MAEMAGGRESKRSEGISTAPVEIDARIVRRARNVRRGGVALLSAFILLGAFTILGVRSRGVLASGGGYELQVLYPAVTRPGLAVRWIVTVRRAGGFDGPVTISTTSRYFNLFDFNNTDPLPTETTTDGRSSTWTFSPPPGDTLEVTMDARMEPARQSGSPATTSVLVGGRPVVSVTYRTRVLP